MEEGSLAAPGILAYGAHGGWTKEQFVTTMRTGTNPAGKELDNEFMPWDIYVKMTDEELTAIWHYIPSLSE